MPLTFTMGEKLGFLARKHTETTSERLTDDSEPCGCKRGRVQFRHIDGRRVALRSVWNGGKTLDGRFDMSPCCEQCYINSIEELNRELE